MKISLIKTVLFLTILLGLSCSNNDDPQEQLPPITQNGANTFGAIVDGKVFASKDSYTFTPGSSLTKGLEVLVGQNFFNSNGNDKWFIRANNFKDTPGTYIYIYIPSLIGEIKNHTIQESDGSDGNERSNLPHSHIYSRIINRGEYRSFENSGKLIFSKINIMNGIYSGTFSVKLKNKDNENEIIEIRNGRFDINLNTVNN